MESLDPANLANVNKSFNKPNEYRPVLERLARRHVYAITRSFIFGLDNDTAGVAERTLSQIREWPPGLAGVRTDHGRFHRQPLYTTARQRRAAHKNRRTGWILRPSTWRTRH